MWEISHETEIAAAHQLRFAPGEGEKLHGHNWRIKATVRANVSPAPPSGRARAVTVPKKK